MFVTEPRGTPVRGESVRLGEVCWIPLLPPDKPSLYAIRFFAALDSGHLGGAALDVVTTEPLAKDSKLLGRDNVILTPHTAFYSVEALNELQTKCAADVARVLSGEKPVYPVKTG